MIGAAVLSPDTRDAEAAVRRLTWTHARFFPTVGPTAWMLWASGWRVSGRSRAAPPIAG